MKFTAFILAAAATSASAQFLQANPFANAFGASPYPVQYQQQFAYPQQQYAPYPIVQPQADPLAWERDCTWVNSLNFRAALSRATCGVDVCISTSPRGNGGGYKRTTMDTDGMHVWGTVINRAGRVCAIAYTGADVGKQFPFGRIQSAKKANTANALSLPKRAMPNHIAVPIEINADFRHKELYTGEILFQQQNARNFGHVMPATGAGLGAFPGVTTTGTLAFGAGVYTHPDKRALAGYPLRTNNQNDVSTRDDEAWQGFSMDMSPGNLDIHYQGAASNYGEACGNTRQDPMCMQKPGGYDYHGGGLALYDAQGVIRGAIGVAGDNDCANHAIAWKTREQLLMDYTPTPMDGQRQSRRLYVGHMQPAQPNTEANHKAHFDNYFIADPWQTWKEGNIGSKAEDNIAFHVRPLALGGAATLSYVQGQVSATGVLFPTGPAGNKVNRIPNANHGRMNLATAQFGWPARDLPIASISRGYGVDDVQAAECTALPCSKPTTQLVDQDGLNKLPFKSLTSLTVANAQVNLLNAIDFSKGQQGDGPYIYCATLVANFYKTNPTEHSVYSAAKV